MTIPRSAKLIQEWVYAAKVVHALRNARIGLLGHPFEGMLDMNVDPTTFTAAFGMHIDMIEMGDLQKRVDDATEEEISAMTRRIEEFFTFPEPGPDRAIAGLVTPGGNAQLGTGCGRPRATGDRLSVGRPVALLSRASMATMMRC